MLFTRPINYAYFRLIMIMLKYEHPRWSTICSVRPFTALHEAFVRRGLVHSNIPFAQVHRTVARLVVPSLMIKPLAEEPPTYVLYCNQEWENILKTKALHLNQLEAALHVSLDFEQPPPPLGVNSLRIPVVIRTPPLSPTPVGSCLLWTRKPYPPAADTEPKYSLKASLRLLFLSVGLGHPSTRFITLSQALCHLRNYIVKHRMSIVDDRNADMILLGNDPLGEIFRVKAFHFARNSVALMKRHLTPVGNLPPKKRFENYTI